MEIYFDNAASTRISDRAAEAYGIARETYANPAAAHRLGRLAEERLKQAARFMAELMGALPEEIVFTSGGTESNALAIFGAAKRPGSRIITSKAEHPSVIECFKKLKERGFDVVFLSPGRDGRIAPESLAGAVDDKTVLVSLMHVNHETGVITDLELLGGIIKDNNKNALFHTDAAQSFGKHTVKRCGADLMSVSAHKTHGPKGVGALYVRKGITLAPLFYGGGQQHGLRPGTENLPGICGLGAAAAEAAGRMDKDLAAVAKIKDRLVSGLKKLDGAKINGDTEKASPYILNVSFEGIPSEVMQNALDARGIYVSAGAACNSAKKAAENVPYTYGLGAGRAGSAIRISLSRENTIAEAETFLENVKQILTILI